MEKWCLKVLNNIILIKKKKITCLYYAIYNGTQQNLQNDKFLSSKKNESIKWSPT